MKQIICILDACSIINLIHIDEDDFLLKKLDEYIEYYLCETVFSEVCANVYTKIDKLRNEKKIKPEEAKERKKEIDITLSNFRQKQEKNSKIKTEFGADFFKTVKSLTNYPKNNGEFYSTALALYISRFKEINKKKFIGTKVFFHTDDYPAKEFFSSFFFEQQIGYIEDTADLLVLLYRLDETFTINQLDRYLSNLFSEYAPEVSGLHKRLQKIKSSLNLKLRRDKAFIKNLDKLIYKLSEFEFFEINEPIKFFSRNSKKYPNVYDAINHYSLVLDLQSNSTGLLEKIRKVRKEKDNVFRLGLAS